MDKNKINKLLGGALLVLLAVFVVVLVLQLASLLYTPTTRACTKKVCLRKFLDAPPAYNDEYMSRFLRSKYFEGPFSGSLNLADNNKLEEDAAYNQTVSYLLDYFKDTKNGKFVVLGAGDGEYRDLTLALEQQKGWTGLLVEPNPHLYKQLVGKNRHAEASSACVSAFTYPSQVPFAFPSFDEQLPDHQKLMRFRETKIKQLWSENFKLEDFKAQCIPLANLLYSSNTIQDTIDLLVLDMAGTDLDILLSTSLDWLPDIKMALMVAHGTDVASEIGGYFLEKNMVVSKVFGNDAKYARFIITKFEADTDMIV